MKLKKYILPFLIFAGIFSFTDSFSQVYSASAKLDTSRIPLGGQAKLQLKVFVPADVLKQKEKFIQWPHLTDSLSKEIEIIEAGQVDTTLSKDKKTYFLTQNLVITSFDTGYWVIQPFRFLRDGDSTKFFETQAMLLEVMPVKVDPEEALRDIKDVIHIPYTFREILPWILGILVLIAAGFFIYRYFNRKNTEQPLIVLKKEPELPPHMIALQRLEELKNKKLWQEGKTKEYHSDLTHIIRTYLEERYKIKAHEQTSDEILISCRTLLIQNESQMKLRQMLKLADLVKFAKSRPIPSENEMSFAHALDFIKSTAPVEEVEPEKVKEDANV